MGLLPTALWASSRICGWRAGGRAVGSQPQRPAEGDWRRAACAARSQVSAGVQRAARRRGAVPALQHGMQHGTQHSTAQHSAAQRSAAHQQADLVKGGHALGKHVEQRLRRHAQHVRARRQRRPVPAVHAAAPDLHAVPVRHLLAGQELHCRRRKRRVQAAQAARLSRWAAGGEAARRRRPGAGGRWSARKLAGGTRGVRRGMRCGAAAAARLPQGPRARCARPGPRPRVPHASAGARARCKAPGTRRACSRCPAGAQPVGWPPPSCPRLAGRGGQTGGWQAGGAAGRNLCHQGLQAGQRRCRRSRQQHRRRQQQQQQQQPSTQQRPAAAMPLLCSPVGATTRWLPGRRTTSSSACW